MKGYMGYILKVNLTTQDTEVFSLDSKLAYKFMGGRGLGIYFLNELAPKGVDPLSPDNPLIFMTGPYTGSIGISSGFYNITSKSPLTYTAGSCHSGGSFGPALKKSGFDGVIFSGKSKEPVSVFIDEREVQFIPSSFLWGKDTYDTLDYFNLNYGKVSVACIGPAGENLLPIAAIMNDRDRAAARGGLGAVMGSKNLKALVLKGNKIVNIANRKGLIRLNQEGIAQIRIDGKAMSIFGTAGGVGPWNSFGGMSSFNHKEGYSDRIERIRGENFKKDFGLKNKGCYACPVACSQINKVSGKKYNVDFIEGPEAETIYALGTDCGIFEPEPIIKGNEICNRMGMDTISVGSTIAMAMEAFESGEINIKDTEGIELRFGNADAMIDLLYLIANKKGFGAVLGKGSQLASADLGTEDYSMTVNGMEIPAAEPRASFGMALSYVTSNRGACHLRSLLYVEEVFRKQHDRFSLENKAKPLKQKEDLMAVYDSIIFCKFAHRYAGWDIEKICEVVEFTNGFNYSPFLLLELGERVYSLERLYNSRQREMEQFLPDRFYEEVLTEGSSKNRQINKNAFYEEIQRYYILRGWDRKGVPTKKKLEELGLHGY